MQRSEVFIQLNVYLLLLLFIQVQVEVVCVSEIPFSIMTSVNKHYYVLRRRNYLITGDNDLPLGAESDLYVGRNKQVKGIIN